MKWQNLQHRVWNLLTQKKLKEKKFLVCVSGGADSMALFWVFKSLPVQMEVFHAHHGPGNNQTFRDQSLEFIKHLCAQEKVLFHSERSPGFLRSENEMRDFRRESLHHWSQQNPDGVIVMGHHAQDLLETRLMRLIRGTSLEGLRSMVVWHKPVLRPFLENSPLELKEFLIGLDRVWLEDPSNKDTAYFRNWIRQKWLTALEKRSEGAVKRLAASLENITSSPVSLNAQKEFSRSEYLALPSRDQLHYLASLLKVQGISQFSLGQLKEVQKRLDNPRGRLSFKVAGAQWTADAHQIRVKCL